MGFRIDRTAWVSIWIGTLAIIGWVRDEIVFLSLKILSSVENGASTNPCSETFAGPHEDSEPETRSLQRFINQSARRWDAYLTFHSYGQYWIYPWGFALHMPDDYLELVRRERKWQTFDLFDRKTKRRSVPKLWNASMERCTRSGQRPIFSVRLFWISSLSPELVCVSLDESAGGSDDWAKGVGQIKYVYTVELRPSDDLNDAHAHFAFMLPSIFIPPVGQETFVGVKEFLRSLINSRKNNKTISTAT